MFIDRMDNENRSGGPDIIVDCSGGCDGSQTCRERYIISQGTVECTCEGSCVMTVTEL
jgi:hypothetical protein